MWEKGGVKSNLCPALIRSDKGERTDKKNGDKVCPSAPLAWREEIKEKEGE